MSSTLMLSKLRLLVGPVLLLVPLACNVDRVSIQTAPEGPTTSAENPDGIDLTAQGVDIMIVDAEEADLVEALLTHRALYHRHLHALRDYYKAHGYARKQAWADFEMEGLRGVKPFRYLVDAEIPSDSLRPVEQIAEADAMFDEARALMKSAGHGIPLVYRQKRMIEAAGMFRALIETYPTSDQIDDAAFYCGEIHREYLPAQAELAVAWYERAFTWDPATPHPARFQAATVSDYRLHDRDRALELYRAVLEHESDNRRNVRFALRRIEELISDPADRAVPAGDEPDAAMQDIP